MKYKIEAHLHLSIDIDNGIAPEKCSVLQILISKSDILTRIIDHLGYKAADQINDLLTTYDNPITSIWAACKDSKITVS